MDTSLINWVNSFEGVEPAVSSLEDLSDGVILHQILREIAPDSFHEGGIKQNVGSNAILKANNIKKLVKDLDAYYRGVFLQSFDVDIVNPASVAAGESEEVVKLTELVLGCAVQCDDKHRYIQKLMALDKTDQANLMVLTQRILSRGEASALDKSESSILEAEDEAEQAVAAEDEGTKAELGALKARVAELESANSDLQQRLAASNDQAAELSNDLQNALSEKARYQTLYNEAVEGASSGPQRAESSGTKEKVQELEMKVEDQEGTISSLEQKLAAKQAELVRMQDDVQIKNSEVESLSADVAKLKGYKEKLEQAGDLKRLLADKESESEKLLEQVVELEQAVDTYKAQLEEKERQAEGLRGKLSQAQKRRPSTEGGAVEEEALQVQLEELEKQHQDTLLELQAVRAELDKAKAERDTALGGGGGEEEDGVADYTVSSMAFDDKKKMVELRTQVARLTKENAELKSRGGAVGMASSEGAGGAEGQELREALIKVQSELKVASASNEKLESEKTALQGEVAELRATMGVTAGASGQLGEEVERLRKSSAEMQASMEKMREEVTKHVEERSALQKEKEKLAATNMEMERKVFEADKKVWEADQKAKSMEGVTENLLLSENRQLKTDLNEKRKLIARKDEELAELTRMKNELQIAAADSTQTTVLQQQLRDMQRKEDEKEKANKRRLAAQEREQKLVVSLMYDLGMELHRTKMYQRANLEKPPLLSWLERKRREMNSDAPPP